MIDLTWSFLSHFVLRMATVLINIVLANIIGPESFASYILLASLLILFSALIESGLTFALIRKEGFHVEEWRSVMTYYMVISLIVFFILICFNEYKSKELLGFFIYFISLPFFLLFNAFLERNKQFKIQFYYMLISFIFSLISTVILSYFTRSYILPFYLFLFQQLIFVFCGAINSKDLRFLIKPKLNIQDLRILFKYSGFIAMSNIVSALYNYLFNRFVASKYDLKTLSFVERPKTYVDMLSLNLANVFSKVYFPKLSMEFWDGDITSSRISSLLVRVFSISLMSISGLAFSIGFIMSVMFNDEWHSILVYLEVLILSSIMLGVNIVFQILFKVYGYNEKYFYIDLARKIVGFVLILFGYMYFRNTFELVLGGVALFISMSLFIYSSKIFALPLRIKVLIVITLLIYVGACLSFYFEFLGKAQLMLLNFLLGFMLLFSSRVKYNS